MKLHVLILPLLLAASASAQRSYCTASTASIPGCKASMWASDPVAVEFSPQHFSLWAEPVPGRVHGFCLTSLVPAARPWGNRGGYLCVSTPNWRSPLCLSTGTPGACNGALVFTLQDILPGPVGVGPGGPGIQLPVYTQVWFRDPGGHGLASSSALTFQLLTWVPCNCTTCPG